MARLRRLALILLLSGLAHAQVLIAPDRVPNGTVGVNYYEEFHATGGTAPYTWKFSGRLPAGITFESAAATLAGVPTESGRFEFRIICTDSARHTAIRTYILSVATGGLSIVWTKAPAVASGAISGEVEVTNASVETVDLTFICVAVNETGRATALGYQHFSFAPGSQRIPFGSTLPRGTYVVHADAVGENARSRAIQRARLQSGALSVP